MSVIHDALMRAERERAAGLVPPAAETATPSPTPPRRRTWPSIIAALGVPLLILSVLFWVRHRNRPSPPPAAPAVARVIPAAAPKPPAPTPAPATVPKSALAPAPAPAPVASLEAARLNAQAVQDFRESRLEEARRRLEEALRLAPAMPEAHNNLGMVLRAQGHRPEAKQEYLRALAQLPGYPEALNNLGVVWSEEGNQPEAIRSFEKALRAKPGYSSAHVNLAIMYDKSGKLAEAFYHYRRFLDSAGTDEKELVRRVQDRLRR